MKTQGNQQALLLFFMANLGRCYLGQVDMLQCSVFTLQSAVDVLRQPQFGIDSSGFDPSGSGETVDFRMSSMVTLVLVAY